MMINFVCLKMKPFGQKVEYALIYSSPPPPQYLKLLEDLA